MLAVQACLQHARAAAEVSIPWRTAVSSLLSTCWSIWAAADQEAKRKAEEEEELYRYRTKTHQITEAEKEVEREQLESLFPSFDEEFSAEHDDADSVMHTEDAGQQRDIDSPDVPTAQSPGLTFTAEEMELICSLHLTVYSKEFRHTIGTSQIASTTPQSQAYYLAAHISGFLTGLPGLCPKHVASIT